MPRPGTDRPITAHRIHFRFASHQCENTPAVPKNFDTEDTQTTMTLKPSNRSFAIRKDATGASLQIKISEVPGLQAENLSLATWGSSFILANQLHKWRDVAIQANVDRGEKDVAVLELGAGTSLVGISAGAIWQLPVIVTDLAPLVAGLAQNIAVNQDLLVERNAKVVCGILDWSQPHELHVHQENGSSRIMHASEGRANVIVAADTVYAEDHPELLINTIDTWMARTPQARVILCYVLRHSYIDIIRDLWERFEARGLECVEEGQQDADPDEWDDVAPFEWCVWRWKKT